MPSGFSDSHAPDHSARGFEKEVAHTQIATRTLTMLQRSTTFYVALKADNDSQGATWVHAK